MNTVLSALAARARDFIRRSTSGSRPHDPPSETEFGELALDLFRAQFEANAAYRALCVTRGVMPEKVRQWRDIPAVPARAFKELELTSLPPEERTAVFFSSGTTEQMRSRHFHSSESLALYEASLKPWFQRHLLGDERPRRLLALTPPANQAPNSSLVHMLEVVVREFSSQPANSDRRSSFFGSVNPDGAWEVDFERLVRTLSVAGTTGMPVLLLGTAFNFVHLLDWLGAKNRRLALPAQSRVMETGGYKGRSRELSRTELHTELAARLVLPPADILTEYGMSELSSQAYGAGGFRFPPWARALVVSPETGREVEPGETGQLRIFDLANVWSVAVLQTEDLAVRREDGFELLGRAKAAEPRGCSLMPA